MPQTRFVNKQLSEGINKLGHEAVVEYNSNFFGNNFRTNVFKELANHTGLQQPVYMMHGKEVICSRECVTMGEGFAEWTPTIEKIKDILESSFDTEYSHCGIIRYRDNEDSLGLHRDSETPNGKICVVSFGATRELRFQEMPRVREGNLTPIRWLLKVNNGDVYQMNQEACGPKSKWKHGVLQNKEKCEIRYVLTFRSSCNYNKLIVGEGSKKSK